MFGHGSITGTAMQKTVGFFYTALKFKFTYCISGSDLIFFCSVVCFNMKRLYSYILSEYSLQMFSLVYLLYSLNHSVKELEGKVICIGTYHMYNAKISIYHDKFFVY
jgi:hypothetical protein